MEVVKKPSRAKVYGAVLCMVSTVGCIAGAAGENLAVTLPSIILFFVGLGCFVVGRFRD